MPEKQVGKLNPYQIAYAMTDTIFGKSALIGRKMSDHWTAEEHEFMKQRRIKLLNTKIFVLFEEEPELRPVDQIECLRAMRDLGEGAFDWARQVLELKETTVPDKLVLKDGLFDRMMKVLQYVEFYTWVALVRSADKDLIKRWRAKRAAQSLEKEPVPEDKKDVFTTHVLNEVKKMSETPPRLLDIKETGGPMAAVGLEEGKDFYYLDPEDPAIMKLNWNAIKVIYDVGFERRITDQSQILGIVLIKRNTFHPDFRIEHGNAIRR